VLNKRQIKIAGRGSSKYYFQASEIKKAVRSEVVNPDENTFTIYINLIFAIL
jgi:hypothetical protein